MRNKLEWAELEGDKELVVNKDTELARDFVELLQKHGMPTEQLDFLVLKAATTFKEGNKTLYTVVFTGGYNKETV